MKHSKIYLKCSSNPSELADCSVIIAIDGSITANNSKSDKVGVIISELEPHVRKTQINVVVSYLRQIQDEFELIPIGKDALNCDYLKQKYFNYSQNG